MNKIIEKYKCPCCGFYTFDEKPNGNYDICPVCFWEDDPIQLEDNEYEGGANRVSLVQARPVSYTHLTLPTILLV